MKELLAEYELKRGQMEALLVTIGKRRKARAYVEGCIETIEAIIRDLKGAIRNDLL